MSEGLSVVLQILDKEYKVGCAADEHDALKEAARLLDARMRQIKQSDKLLTLDRIAVLAALMFATETLGKNDRFESLSESLDAELKRINQQLDDVLRAA